MSVEASHRMHTSHQAGAIWDGAPEGIGLAALLRRHLREQVLLEAQRKDKHKIRKLAGRHIYRLRDYESKRHTMCADVE